MFEGDGFGVGLTVAPLDLALPDTSPPEGVTRRPSRLAEVLPPAGRSRAGKAVELGRVRTMVARLQAYEAALVVGLAADCPDTDDRCPGEPGAASADRPGVAAPVAGVGEFFVDELAAALGTSVTAAGATWALDTTLHDRLPGTWAAPADGELDWPRGRAIATEVMAAAGAEPVVCMAVEAAVLPVAGELTVTRLRALVRAELVAHDAAYADRRRRAAERQADARVRTDPAVPGRAVLETDLSVEDAHACWALADTLARATQAAGDPRPIGVLRAEAIRDRILGSPDPDGTPAVATHLTVTAPIDTLTTSSTPSPADPEHEDLTRRRRPIAEVAGRSITAAHLRALLESVDALCPGGLQPPTGDCACGLIDRPPDVDRYRPSPAQYTLIRTRDRGCRAPGCTARAAWADLDHVIPHACRGTTGCDNLCCLCRRHHRLETRARGWTTRLHPDGTYTVTSPSGITRTTRPPGMLTAAMARAPAPTPAPGPDPPPF